MRTTQQIIEEIGAIQLSEAAEVRGETLTADAARKWKRNGIPEDRWPLVQSLVDVTVEELHWANEHARGRIALEAAND